MSHLLRSDQLGPNQMPIVGAQVTAGDGTACGAFDSGAVNGIGRTAASAPVAHGCLRNANGSSQLPDSTKAINGNINGFHHCIITPVIKEGNTRVIHESDAMPDMETIGKRLKRLRTEKGLSQGALAKAAGLKSQGTIGNIENETREYGQSVVDIANVLGVSPDYLRCLTNIPNKTTQQNNVEPGPDTRGKVPLISWVQAGAWCHAGEQPAICEVERWMDCPRSHSAQTFVLRVRGDSMNAPHGKTYPEGCYIFVDGAMQSPINGQHVVACLKNSGDTTFKVFKDEDGRQWLSPLNPQHPTIHEPFHVLGTVIGKWEDI